MKKGQNYQRREILLYRERLIKKLQCKGRKCACMCSDRNRVKTEKRMGCVVVMVFLVALFTCAVYHLALFCRDREG